jgi:hypothetical protein
MRGLIVITALILGSCGPKVPLAKDERIVEELKVIQNLKVYFGHQSVGGNIIEGLRAIEKVAGRGPLLSDSLIGQNGDPVGKCEDFSRKIAAMATTPASLPDVALMKFCYIDFSPDSDAAKLFAHYSSTLDGLQAKYSEVTFIPVTTPLTTLSPAWKRVVKKLMGSTDAGSATNARRAEFNRMLAKHYAGRTIFDVARVESTHPDGTRTSFEWDGQTAYGMVDAYSSDGGHLNPLGERVAATELIHTLAAAARTRNARVSPRASFNDTTSW